MSKHSNRNYNAGNAETDDKEPQGPETIESTPGVQFPGPAPVTESRTEPPARLAIQSLPSTSAPKMLPIQSELVAFSQVLNVNKPVDGRWQYSLFELFRATIENPNQEVFERHWGAILMFFHRSKGSLFSEMHILRPSDGWQGSEMEFSLFRRLVHVIVETSDPATRSQAVRRIDMTRATESLTEDGRNRLISYYG